MTPFIEHFSRFAGSAMLRQMKLGEWVEQFQHHAVNISDGTISFDNRVTLPIQLIGSVSLNAQSWVWAWANDESNFSDAVVEQSRRVKAYGEQHQISEVTKPRYPLTEFNAHVLAMLAAGICDNRVYISAPNNDLEIYFFIDDTGIDFSSPWRTDTVLSVMMQVVNGFELDHRIFAEAFLTDQGFEVRDDGESVTCSRDGDHFRLVMDEGGRLTSIKGAMGG